MPMAQWVATLLFAVFLSSPVSADQQLREQTFLAGKVRILVPESFAPMDEEMLRLKYPYENRPTTVLTNPKGSINVALNHTKEAVDLLQIADAHAVTDQAFRKMYPSARWNRSEVTSINGRPFYILELRTPAMDTEIFNVIAATSLGGRLLIISFNCTKVLEATWAPIGRRIINSIVISE